MEKARVEVWAYCLMPNHVHLILCPAVETGLARAMGAAHRRWANHINARGRWRGHLFDGRYASVATDEPHFVTAVRHVALNPVRARLVPAAEEWPWSGVRAHLKGENDSLVVVEPVLRRVKDFAALIRTPANDGTFAPLRAAELIGRPLGSDEFICGLERMLGLRIARGAPGRKKPEVLFAQSDLFGC